MSLVVSIPAGIAPKLRTSFGKINLPFESNFLQSKEYDRLLSDIGSKTVL